MIPKNQEAKKNRHDSKTQTSNKRAQTKCKQKNKSMKTHATDTRTTMR